MSQWIDRILSKPHRIWLTMSLLLLLMAAEDHHNACITLQHHNNAHLILPGPLVPCSALPYHSPSSAWEAHTYPSEPSQDALHFQAKPANPSFGSHHMGVPCNLVSAIAYLHDRDWDACLNWHGTYSTQHKARQIINTGWAVDKWIIKCMNE